MEKWGNPFLMQLPPELLLDLQELQQLQQKMHPGMQSDLKSDELGKNYN